MREPLALAVASVVGAIAPVHAQDQKGTLVFAVESLGAQTLDPILEGRPGNAVYQAVMYDSLVGFDLKKGGVGPGVAERWELSPDGLTWTFFIRPGQTFHNGDKLTAHDVKFSLERQMGPGSLAAAAASMKRTIKSIEVVDDLTVKVHTDQPADRPAGQPVARRGARGRDHAQELHREGGRGGVPQEADRQRPVEVRAQRAGRSHRVHRRRQCTGAARRSFKDLHVLLVPEESTRVAMVRTGEAAIASIGPETMLSASRAGLEVLAVPGTMQAIFQFWGTYKPEMKDSPIAKPRVRQALSLAIDRKQVIEHVMNGKARMPYPFSTFAYTDYFSADRWEKWAAEAYRYDPALAKKMLAEEGYPNGFELKFANTALPGTQFMVDIGTAIADMWTKVGVKVTLKHYEWGSFAPHGARRPGAADRLGLDVPHRRPARRAVALQRRLLARQHAAPAGRQGQLRRDLPGVRRRSTARLGSELDKAKRTALTDRMVELIDQLLDGRADHRGHGLLRHQHQEGRPVRGDPRPPRAGRRLRAHPAPGAEALEEVSSPRPMKRFIARRLMQGVVLLFMVATIVFFLGRLTGNPVDLMLPEDATAEDRAAPRSRRWASTARSATSS